MKNQETDFKDQVTGKKFTGLRRELLLPLLFDVVFPLAGYYGLRFMGVHAFMALILGALPTVVYQLFQIINHKKADFLALFILSIILLSVAISFVTGSARFMLAKSGWLTGAIGISFLVSLLGERPFAYRFAKNFLGRLGISECLLERLWESKPKFRRVWDISTIIWGVGTLTNAVVLLYMAYTLPVDTVPLLASLLHAGTVIILQAITNIYYRQQGIWKLIFNKKAVEQYKEQ